MQFRMPLRRYDRTSCLISSTAEIETNGSVLLRVKAETLQGDRVRVIIVQPNCSPFGCTRMWKVKITAVLMLIVDAETRD